MTPLPFNVVNNRIKESETHAHCYSTEEDKIGCCIAYDLLYFGANKSKDGKFTLHAEMDALLNLKEHIDNSPFYNMYVTHPSCNICADRLLDSIKLKQVYTQSHTLKHWLRDESKWTDRILKAGETLLEHGVEYYVLHEGNVVEWNDMIERLTK